MAEGPVWFIGRRFFSAGSTSRLASFISFLAMTGLVLGVGLLIVVLSVMNGFDREMRTRILGLVPHIQLFENGGIGDWPLLADELERIEGVASATPFTLVNGMLSYRGRIVSGQLQGLCPERLDIGLAQTMPADFGALLEGNGIALSETLATRLGIGVGERLTVIVPRLGTGGEQLAPQARALEVVVLFNTHTAEDNALAIVHIDTAGALSGLGDRPQGLRIRLDDVFAARDMGYALINNLPVGFSFIDWFQTHGNLYQAIKMSRQLVGLLIFLIVAIAVFNVVSMLVMTVVDKKPAIAILKTLGATKGAILGIFFVQGSLIGLCGCFLGILFGVPTALYIPDMVGWLESALGFRFLNSEIYPIDYLPTDVQMSDVMTVAGVALALNFVATLYPAWKAAQTKPADVLRYE